MSDKENQESTVGKSSRTPVKHAMYNTVLGSMVGALSTGKTPCAKVLLVVDLCAGDGADTQGELSSSPSITRHHLEFKLPPDKQVARTAIFYEKDIATFSRLRERHGDCPQITLINQDSREFSLDPVYAKNNASVLIYADPNNVDQLPLTKKLMDSLTPTTLFMITMGCNAGGLKRLTYEHRAKWFDMAMMIIDWVKPWQDLCLFSLNNDKSQWAYILIIPNKWSEDFTKKMKVKAGKIWKSGMTATSFRRDGKSNLENKLDELFLTQKEKEAL